MNMRLIVGIISFCIGTTGALMGSMFQIMMIGEINRKRADGDQVSYLGFWLQKTLRIFREYRQLYPSGRLYTYAIAAISLTLVGFIGVAVCLLMTG